MNASIKSALLNPNSSLNCIKYAFFHSTTSLERGRRNAWTARYSNNRRSGYKRNHFKQNLMRDSEAYVEHLFERWESDYEHDDQPSKKGPSWFRQPRNESRRNGSNNQGRQHKGRGGYNFCEDDDDVEYIVRSAFGGDRFFFWSFINEDHPNQRNSSRNRSKTSWKQNHHFEDEFEDEYEYRSEHFSKKTELASERTALGLSTSGPLKLDDVKHAYRACALKWHPDRHQGSSKVAAEEKFKACTAAYQSICDRLAIN